MRHRADALRLMNERLPDLVVLDAEMPGESGFEFCARLKAHPDFRSAGRRTADFAARLGGEEFALLLPDPAARSEHRGRLS